MIMSFTLPTNGINFGDRMFIILIIITRSFVIGVRYGFMSNVRYRLLHSKADFSWITNDFLFLGWLKPSPKTLHEEIEAAKFRAQISDDEFGFTFSHELPPTLAEKLQKEDYYEKNAFSEKELKTKISIHKKIIFRKRKETGGSYIDDEFEIIHDLEKGTTNRRNVLQRLESGTENSSKNILTNRHKIKRSYKGDPILREIGLLESALIGFNWPLFFIVLVRVCLPSISHLYDMKLKIDMYWYEYFMVTSNVIIILLIYAVNLTFIYAGIIDFRRKLFYMKILHSMISPEKDKNFAFSTYFPTLNICCTKNLNSWMLLRQACMELGKKYTYRIFVYCSVFMAFYLSLFIFLVLSYFGILEYQLPTVVYFTGAFDVVVVLGILFYMIWLGAQVNEYFLTHKGIFINLKKHFWEAKNNYARVITRYVNKN